MASNVTLKESVKVRDMAGFLYVCGKRKVPNFSRPNLTPASSRGATNSHSRLADKLGGVTPHFAAVEDVDHAQLLNRCVAELANGQMDPFLAVPLGQLSPASAGRG